MTISADHTGHPEAPASPDIAPVQLPEDAAGEAMRNFGITAED